MANRRMFTRQITESDAFLEMPDSAQSLYFHFNMNADDDGFIGSPKKIMKMLGSAEDDLKILLAKRFVLAFETGIIVIKHWRMHNLLRKDRYTETQYLEEKSNLIIKDNGSYTERQNMLEIQDKKERQPVGNQLAPQDRIGKDRIEREYSSLSFLRKLPKEVINEMVLKFKVEPEQVIHKANALVDYCESKGRKYKNYKSFLSNTLRKDFGERPLPKKKQKYEIINGVAQMVGYE